MGFALSRQTGVVPSHKESKNNAKHAAIGIRIGSKAPFTLTTDGGCSFFVSPRDGQGTCGEEFEEQPRAQTSFSRTPRQRSMCKWEEKSEKARGSGFERKIALHDVRG